MIERKLKEIQKILKENIIKINEEYNIVEKNILTEINLEELIFEEIIDKERHQLGIKVNRIIEDEKRIQKIR